MTSPIKILHPYPALILEEDRRYLVVADLHIGFEAMFAESGVRIESSSRRMLDDLSRLIVKYRPDRLFILGDVKHSVEAITGVEWREVPHFVEKLLASVPVTLIQGNHDGGLSHLLPKSAKLASTFGIMLGDTGLLHGHTLPSRRLSAAKRIVMGHLHPTYSRAGSPLTGKQVWLLLRAKRTGIWADRKRADSLEIYVMPSFNRELSLAGFTAARGRIISPLLRRATPHIDGAYVMTLEGDIVGDASSLRYVL